jgi:hypothetical protein
VCFDERMTWADAEKACRELRLGGHDDWRLPTIAELLSIMDYTKSNPAIDTEAFPNTPSEWFWTATPYAGDSDLAWFVDGNVGNSYIDRRGDDLRVRAVRGPARQ